MTLTRRYRFSASHRLHTNLLSEEENQQIYGKCNNPFGHGHNYELEVSVRGPVNSLSGRVVDLETLDNLVRPLIVDAFDHRYLNAEVDAFRETVPTSENLAREIWSRLEHDWARAFPSGAPRLEKVRIAETERNIFEVSAT